MAKELMEIGGFITEGAEIVNHDASLSGNGTVESPLGVVPGYNETVLYSSTQNTKTTSFTLSEPLTAFEKVRFEITGYTNVYAENTHQTPSANNEEITTCFTYYAKNSDANPLQMLMGTYSSNDGLNYGLVRSKFLYMSNSATVWQGNTTDGPHLQKIVGINRKAQ